MNQTGMDRPREATNKGKHEYIPSGTGHEIWQNYGVNGDLRATLGRGRHMHTTNMNIK